MKKLLSNKTNYVLVQNELKEQQNKIKSYKHFIKSFYWSKLLFLMMDHRISKYFN